MENYVSDASGDGSKLILFPKVIAGANSSITYGSVDYLTKASRVISFVVDIQKRMPLWWALAMNEAANRVTTSKPWRSFNK